MKKPHLHLLIAFVALIVIGVSCKKNKSDDPTATNQSNNTTTTSVKYDRTAFLNNMGQNVIIPRYLDLKTKMSTLTSSASTFTNTPTTTNLAAAQADFLAAYKSWETVSQFAFGPADVNNLVTTQVNAFPANATTINNNITSGSYDFSSSSSASFSGFPAIDYLLFSKTGSAQDICDSYNNSSNRKKYLNDVIADLTNKINTVYSQWISGSNYLSVFKALNGTDVSSSTSALLNQMALELDNFKNYKLGIPLGAYNAVGSAPSYNASHPEESEGYYSDSSLTLMKQAIISMRDMYTGKTVAGVDSTGFDDYLIAINQASVNTAIINQFNVVINKVNAIPETYSQSLSDANKKVLIENVFTETTLLLKNIKVDLSTAIAVEITFSDNDGD